MSNSLTSMIGNIKAEFMVKMCCLFFQMWCFFCKCVVLLFVFQMWCCFFCNCGVCWQNMVFSFKENYYENVYTLNVFSLAKTVFDAGLNI